MFNVHVERQIDADIKEIFELLADHANYDKFKDVESSKLLEKGASGENGVGALRELKIEGTLLRERIVQYHFPTKLGYKIEYSKPFPFRHDYGLIELEENENGVLVTWRSKGKIDINLFTNWYFEHKIEQVGIKAFSGILDEIAELTAESSQSL